MGDKTGIEWTDATWNPVTGCTKVSQGCKNCYAKHQAWPRLKASPATVYFGREFEEVQWHHERLEQPLRWAKPRRIFVNSMSDLFHENVPDMFICAVFAVMETAWQHTFQILTKRADRMRKLLSVPSFYAGWMRKAGYDIVGPKNYVPRNPGWPLPNVWLGVSVEDQATADERIPLLLQTPAAVRWISAEPLLAPIDLRAIWTHCPVHDFSSGFCVGRCPDRRHLDWAVVGGESGSGARPMHPEWARSIRDQCAAAGVSFLFKQWGEWVPDNYGGHGRDLVMDGARCAWFDGAQWIYEPSGYAVNLDDSRGRGEWVYRLGKRNAGRQLDGIEHNEYPA